MANGKSGDFTLTGTKAGITAYFSWAEAYDAIKNQSDYVSVGMKVKSSQYIDAYWLNGTIKVNGTTIITFNSELGSHCADILTKNTYYSVQAKGNYTAQPWKSGAIAHNSDGSKSVVIAVDITAYTTSGENGSGWKVSGSKTITLYDIDRDAPKVSFSVSNVTEGSFQISATANAKCNKWYYSLNDGSTWTRFSTSNGTSASTSVTGLSALTSYNVKVRVLRTYNEVYGTSAKMTVKTLGYAKPNSFSSFSVDVSTAKMQPEVTVYNSKFKYYITLKDDGTELFTTDALTWTAGKAVRTVTLTNEQKNLILAAMSNVKSKSFDAIFKTYDGSTCLAELPMTCTAKTSASRSTPKFDGFTYADISHIASLIKNPSILLQGFSILKVTVLEATAQNCATISGYTVSISDKTLTSTTSGEITVGAIKDSGNFQLTVSAIDSRGYSTSVTTTVTVLPYEIPNIRISSLRRANSIDEAIQLSLSGYVSPIKPDGETEVNSIKMVAYQYKLTSESSYSMSQISLTSLIERSDDSLSFTYKTNELVSLDKDKSYDFTFFFIDGVTFTYVEATIPKGTPLIAARKDKLGIKTPNPMYTLDVAGDIGFSGGLYNAEGRNIAGDTGWVELGLSDAVAESEDDYGHHLGCAYRVVGGNHVYVAFGCSAEWAGTTMYVNNEAIPYEYRPKRSVFAIVPLGGKYVARIFVNKLGYAAIEWVQYLLSADETESRSISWIDGYLDYWI